MSDDRKARVAALAARAGRGQQPAGGGSGSGPGQPGENEGVGDGSRPVLSFRNYVPKDSSLDASATPTKNDESGGTGAGGGGRKPAKRRKASDRPDGEGAAPPPKSKSALEAALAKTSRESREAAGQNAGAAGGWATVTPVSTRKVNWDLKRDIQGKMDRLERRTQRAIVELLRERLEREAAAEVGEGGGGDDLD